MVDEKNSDAGRVRLKGRLVCESAREAEIVRAHLAEHIRLERLEVGCLSFDVVQRDDPLIWHVDECFRDEEAFAFHQRRTRESAWWSATAEIRREYEID